MREALADGEIVDEALRRHPSEPDGTVLDLDGLSLLRLTAPCLPMHRCVMQYGPTLGRTSSSDSGHLPHRVRRHDGALCGRLTCRFGRG
jgi:hypothetical protein